VTDVVFTTAEIDAGGRGNPTIVGVKVTVFDAVLVPTAFTANTRKAYAVPPTRPETRAERRAVVVVVVVDHVAPLSVDI
jgi:hypothetical protein